MGKQSDLHKLCIAYIQVYFASELEVYGLLMQVSPVEFRFSICITVARKIKVCGYWSGTDQTKVTLLFLY